MIIDMYIFLDKSDRFNNKVIGIEPIKLVRSRQSIHKNIFVGYFEDEYMFFLKFNVH